MSHVKHLALSALLLFTACARPPAGDEPRGTREDGQDVDDGKPSKSSKSSTPRSRTASTQPRRATIAVTVGLALVTF